MSRSLLQRLIGGTVLLVAGTALTLIGGAGIVYAMGTAAEEPGREDEEAFGLHLIHAFHGVLIGLFMVMIGLIAVFLAFLTLAAKA